MKNPKLVALSAVSAALAVIFITLGVFVEVLDISCLFTASMCVMLPLSKKSVRAAIMTYLATAILAVVFFAAVKPEIVISYAAFFGLHPIVNHLCGEKKINAFLSAALKTLWFVAYVLLLYTFSRNFLFDDDILSNEIFQKFAYLILSIGSALLFILYDFAVMHFQKVVDNIIKRLKL